MNSEIYNELNKAWKTTCRITLGEEIGELLEFKPWLDEYMSHYGKRKSYKTGKEVTLALDDYCKDARFISADEIYNKKYEPLKIDEIKDIDSLISAISERWEYTGNRVLGNSAFVDSSDLVMDSQYVSESVNIQQSSKVFSSSLLRMNCKHVFGCIGSAKLEFGIRAIGIIGCSRVFEGIMLSECSDVYYSNNCAASHDIMFCFNQRNKKYSIGNLELSKEKYMLLKKKILEEIAEKLRGSKKYPSLLQLIPNKYSGLNIKQTDHSGEKKEIYPIRNAAASTFKIIFKKKINGFEEYEQWLSKYAYKMKPIKTEFGDTSYLPKDNRLTGALLMVPDKRLISNEESEELGKISLAEEEIGSLSKITENLEKIGFFVLTMSVGRNQNLLNSPSAYNSTNIYSCSYPTLSEYCAFASSPLNSKYIFGGSRSIDSSFCVNCYNSLNLTRCFEMDSCTGCSDSFFCHNCEGLQEAMFCWNVKSKRHAIGNTQLPPDQYRRIKDILMGQLADEIIQTKGLKYDIFNIGCG